MRVRRKILASRGTGRFRRAGYAHRWAANYAQNKEMAEVECEHLMGKVLAFLVVMLIVIVTISGCTDNELTPEKVIEQQDKWLNQTITIQGVVGTFQMSCTEQACDPEYPCCNECAGLFGLFDNYDAFVHASSQGAYAYLGDGAVIYLEFQNGGGCRGNECDVSCEPLQLGERYTLTGLISACSDIVPRCTMKVESFEPR